MKTGHKKNNYLSLNCTWTLNYHFYNLEISKFFYKDFHYVQISFTKLEYMNTSGTAILEHLLNNHQCPMSYYESVFSVLSQLHSDFHLNHSETIFINSRQPSLCKQKGWLLGLNIICLWCICICWHIINICVYPIFI